MKGNVIKSIVKGIRKNIKPANTDHKHFTHLLPHAMDIASLEFK